MNKYIGTMLFLTALIFSSPVLADESEDEDSPFGGKILLQVESRGEAWYVDPDSDERVYLGRPSDAFMLMRGMGLGISNSDLAKIPTENENNTGDIKLRDRLAGRILLQVQSKGEAWYVNPESKKRTYLGRPDDAFQIMKKQALGISNKNIVKLKVKTKLNDRILPTRHINVLMDAQSGSTQSGIAELYDFGDKTKVEVRLLNPPVGTPQPAHIHQGTCAAMGTIKYDLSPLSNGKSETMLSISLDKLMAELPLVINVHQSAQNIATSVACGPLTLNVRNESKEMEREREREREREINRNFPSIEIALSAMNGSGQKGRVEMYDLGTMTKLEIRTNASSSSSTQAAQIRVGACSSIGTVKYHLKPLINGRSETLLDTSLSQLLLSLPLSIHIQKSSSSDGTVVACADIIQTSEMDDDTNDDMDEDLDDDMDDDLIDDMDEDLNDDSNDDMDDDQNNRNDDINDDADEDVNDDNSDDMDDDSQDDVNDDENTQDDDNIDDTEDNS